MRPVPTSTLADSTRQRWRSGRERVPTTLMVTSPLLAGFIPQCGPGRRCIVWGGMDAQGYLNSGGRYSPESDSWLATDRFFDVPLPRSRHTAVWTGTEMIVWGGYGILHDAGAYLNTGGRDKPTTNRWSAVATVWCPVSLRGPYGGVGGDRDDRLGWVFWFPLEYRWSIHTVAFRGSWGS